MRGFTDTRYTETLKLDAPMIDAQMHAQMHDAPMHGFTDARIHRCTESPMHPFTNGRFTNAPTHGVQITFIVCQAVLLRRVAAI